MPNWDYTSDNIFPLGTYVKVKEKIWIFNLYKSYISFFSNRVFALILLFTPTLGLFDTLHLGRLATLPVSANRGGEKFDYTDGGKIIEFEDAWEQYRIDNSSEFVDMPAIAVLATMLIMFIFHIFATSSILKLKLWKECSARSKWWKESRSDTRSLITFQIYCAKSPTLQDGRGAIDMVTTSVL